VVSRSVRDIAAILDAVCNKPNAGFFTGLVAAPKGLRVAVVRSAMLGASVDPEVRSGLERAAKLLETLGHHVEDAEPHIYSGEVGMAFLTYWAVGAMQFLDDAERVIGQKATPANVELATWTLASVGRSMSADDVAHARAVIAKATQAFTEFFDKYDILVSPTLAAPPLTIGQNRITATEKIAMRIVGGIKSPWLMKALLKQVAAKSFAFAAFTAPFNMTGQPAISLPLHWTANGLPIGIQFAASAGADALLLKLARQLEIAQPWAQRRPPVWAGEQVRELA
jgi:amidase